MLLPPLAAVPGHAVEPGGSLVTHHQQKDIKSDGIISTSSIVMDLSSTPTTTTLTQYQHHLIADENGITSTSDSF